METYVYADILFIINFSMDYLCLYVTAKILRRAVSLKRLLISSLLGAVYSVLSLFLPVTSGVALAIDVLVCFFMSAIAFHIKKQTKKTFLSALLYFLVSMTVGGIMTAFYNLLNKFDLPLGALESDGLSVWGFAFLAIIAAAFSLFGGGIIFKKKEVKTCTLTLTFDKKTVTLRGLSDSGNLARDALSGKPVIIIDRAAAEEFVDEKILNDFLNGIPPKNPAYSSMRPAPINTVSGKSMIVLLRAEKMVISCETPKGHEEFCPDALFALGDVGKGDGDCQAVIPYSLFRG